MKISLLFFAFLAPALGLPPIGKDDWFLLASHAGEGEIQEDCNMNFEEFFCATTQDGASDSGTHVVIQECTFDDVGGWRIEKARGQSGFLLKLGSTYEEPLCMQAGDGDRQARVRVRPCDSDHPLQRWVWDDYTSSCGDDRGAKIKLESNTDLCLTWFGASGVDEGEVRRVIIKPCGELHRERAKGWWAA
ncbi:expressed unknown protein [Seminavis robusta]|uniref:Ricin B lectin domain-containing protein n=1 Tax=Seminavis robusta TaxID=568900 RepID=A0A9N8HGD0_9STRA|nr:expressed unknown protein [Seminavis robusta]|eukprot:Sro570_g168560.1 n/a (190) ;mRNA; f:46629-47287